MSITKLRHREVWWLGWGEEANRYFWAPCTDMIWRPGLSDEQRWFFPSYFAPVWGSFFRCLVFPLMGFISSPLAPAEDDTCFQPLLFRMVISTNHFSETTALPPIDKLVGGGGCLNDLKIKKFILIIFCCAFSPSPVVLGSSSLLIITTLSSFFSLPISVGFPSFPQLQWEWFKDILSFLFLLLLSSCVKPPVLDLCNSTLSVWPSSPLELTTWILSLVPSFLALPVFVFSHPIFAASMTHFGGLILFDYAVKFDAIVPRQFYLENNFPPVYK